MSGKRLVPHLSGQTDSISRKPIVTTKDFIFLRLETDYSGKYTINGQISKYKMNKWVKETERATGRQIAFVFNDSIIARPRVNCRIENGVFQITSISDKKLPDIYKELKQEKLIPLKFFSRTGKRIPFTVPCPRNAETP